MAKPTTIRLFIIEDQPIMLLGLKHLFQAYPLFRIIKTQPKPPTKLDEIRGSMPDIVLVGCSVDGFIPFEFVQMLKTLYPTLPVCIFYSFLTRKSLGKLIEMGVEACVIKGDKPANLLAVLKDLHFRRPLQAIPSVTDYDNVAHGRVSLSSRQKDVLSLAGDGFTDKEIGAQLGICSRTVEGHRNRIMKIFNLKRKAELTKVALSTGLIEFYQPSFCQGQERLREISF